MSNDVPNDDQNPSTEPDADATFVLPGKRDEPIPDPVLAGADATIIIPGKKDGTRVAAPSPAQLAGTIDEDADEDQPPAAPVNADATVIIPGKKGGVRTAVPSPAHLAGTIDEDDGPLPAANADATVIIPGKKGGARTAAPASAPLAGTIDEDDGPLPAANADATVIIPGKKGSDQVAVPSPAHLAGTIDEDDGPLPAANADATVIIPGKKVGVRTAVPSPTHLAGTIDEDDGQLPAANADATVIIPGKKGGARTAAPASAPLAGTIDEDDGPLPAANADATVIIPGKKGGARTAAPASAPLAGTIDEDERAGGDDGRGGPKLVPTGVSIGTVYARLVAPDADQSAADAEPSIISTIAGAGDGDAAARVSAGTLLTPEAVREQWGSFVAAGEAAGAAAGHGATVHMADAESRRTAEVTVTLRPGAMEVADAPSGGDFALVKALGVGGMGAVFRARQNSLNRNVAIKVIKPDAAESDRVRNKFIAEAVITGALDHPNIIPIYELGVTDDAGVFYAMKEVKGRSWSSTIREAPEAENLDILLRVCDAVAFAHERGVIHRDLKPENVMLGDFGEVLVMDWGIAIPYRPLADGRRVPAGRAGTPAYMAPEMARADTPRIGPASDVYLLGAILYEMTTGVLPHTGDSLYSCLASAANNVVEPSEKTGELVDIARKAMSTRPEDRHASVKDFQEALRDYQRHQESVVLCARADESAAQAEHSRGYELYNKAIFGYAEAIALWPENARAKKGEAAARRRLAEQAIIQGDYDLALGAIADMGGADEAVARLRENAVRAKAENEARAARIKRLKRWAMILVGAVLAVLTVAVVWVSHQKSLTEKAWSAEAEQRQLAEESEREAVKQKGIAEEHANEAIKQKGIAEEKEREATKQKGIAEEHASEAIKQKGIAEDKTREAVAALAAEKKAIAEREKAQAAEIEALRAANEAMKAREEAEARRKEAEAEAARREEDLGRAGFLIDSGRWALEPAAAREKQAESAREAGHAESLTIPLDNAKPLEFRWIPAGDFIMGSPPGEIGREAEESLHPVAINRPFWLAATELTRGQWRALVGIESADDFVEDRLTEFIAVDGEDTEPAWLWRTLPIPPEGADLPAGGLSMRDIRGKLLPALAGRAPAGLAFRLPTEAEWEYAARAGRPTRFYTGDADEDGLAAGWTVGNSDALPHPVAGRAANPWGLYDMVGNVFEQVADAYRLDYYRLGPKDDPLSAADDPDMDKYVVRGGSYDSVIEQGRSAYRVSVFAGNRYAMVGARLALSAPVPPPPTADDE